MESKIGTNSSEIICKLDDLRRRIEPYEEEEEIFLKLMNEFWLFIASIQNICVVTGFERTECYKDYQKFFRRKWSKYLRVLERRKTLAFLKLGKNSCLRELSSVLIEENYLEADCELLLVKGIKEQVSEYKLIMVGCGAYPETLLKSYSENVGIKEAIGIDFQENAVAIANDVIKKIFPLDLNKRIWVSHCDGANFDYSEADIILLANGLVQKNEVLNQIFRTASYNTSVLVRSPILLGKMLYEEIAFSELSQHFSMVSSIKPSILSQTSLLVKRWN